MLKFNKNLFTQVAVSFVLSFLLITILNADEKMFTVTGTGDDYTRIEFHLTGYETIPFEIDGVHYVRIYHPESGYIIKEGYPELLSFSFILSLPERGNVELGQTMITETNLLKTKPIFPSQGFNIDICEERGFLLNEDFYLLDTHYPDQLISIGKPAVMRDERLVAVTVNPFSYNPSREELTVNSSISFQIDYNLDSSGENELLTPPRRRSRVFDTLYRDTVLNYGQFRNPDSRSQYQQQSLLVIHHPNPGLTNLLKPFLDWKRDKGYLVTAVNTANMTTNIAIKNYIQDAYDNWENPPEYIAIVGGGTGSLSVPHWTFETAPTDYPYALLSGDDYLGDVFIGRISIADTTGYKTFWNKLSNYEVTPFTADPAWLRNSLLVSDSERSGASTFNTTKYVREMMTRFNNNYTFNEVNQAPYPASIVGVLNQGVSFFCYRGIATMDNWVPTDAELFNGFRLPNASLVITNSLDYQGGRVVEPLFRLGSPTVAKGAITAIGMTHTSTTTALNNLITAGVYHSIFQENTRTMGKALTHAKLHTWRVYGNSHPVPAENHIHFANLIGDPSMDIWIDVPRTLTVNHVQQLPQGSNSIAVTVTDNQQQPVPNAIVTIRKDDNTLLVSGKTNAEGIAVVFFNPEAEGQMNLTVTKPDFRPYRNNLTLTTAAPAVGYHSAVVNDNLYAGNQAGFNLRVKNHRPQQVNTITGTISTESDFIEIITAQAGFGVIDADSIKTSTTAYSIQISPDTPSGEEILFNLALSETMGGNWQSRFKFTVFNGNLEPVDIVIEDDDNDNGVLDPGESATVFVHINNAGIVDLTNIYGMLLGGGNGLTVIDTTAFFGNIASGQTVTSRESHWTVLVDEETIPGRIYDLEAYFFNEAGFSQSKMIKIQVGEVNVNTPLGPDSYGYWCFDDGDLGYEDTPVYNWREIAPDMGGPGTNTNLQSDYDNVQQVMTMNLPFPFRFYGVQYNQISICANGWVSFGITAQSTQRNWRLPGPLGPKPIIAAFWDNLSLEEGGVYTYNDNVERAFIIQWQNARNVMNDEEETFQIILYNQQFYYTETGDGPIKIQYKVFNNVNNGANVPPGIGNWGNYCTVGIADHTNTVGLEYSFNNTYPLAAKPIENETALFFTTGYTGGAAQISIQDYSISDDNNNIPEFGETVRLNMSLYNRGSETAAGVTATISTDNPYVNILANQANFGNIDGRETVTVNNAFRVIFADNIPDREQVTFNLVATSGGSQWSQRFIVEVYAPKITTLIPIVNDSGEGGNNNGVVDPGEDVVIYLPIKNIGGADTPFIEFEITRATPFVTINSISETSYNTIRAGDTKYPSLSISVSHEAVVGTGLLFNYVFDTGDYEFRGQFMVAVGGIFPAQLGAGNAFTDTATPCPINIYFKSLRSQTVYTAAEMNNAGISASFPIIGFGYWIASRPAHPLVNFIIRMRHTNAVNAEAHIPGPYQTVYTNPSYSPLAGDWHIVELTNPFLWNGVDNILVDTAFAPVAGWSSTGQVRYYEVANGFRFVRGDTPDQTNVETTTVSSNKPQVMMLFDTGAGDASNRPLNLNAELVGRRVELDWEAPEGRRSENSNVNDQRRSRSAVGERNPANLLRNPDGYNVYRDGLKINEELVINTNYVDETIPERGIYYYFVTAIFNETETLPSNVVAIDYNMADNPIFEPAAGFLSAPTYISITAHDATIYYTLDGSEPTEQSTLYEAPFEIIWHTLVKARAYRDDWIPSNVRSAQYTFLYPPRNVTGEGTTEAANLSWEVPWTPDREQYLDDDVSTTFSRVENTRDVNIHRQISRRRVASTNRDGIADNSRNLLGYNVYRAVGQGNFTKRNTTIITNTNYQDTGLNLGMYRYYITAVYDNGESAPSETIFVGIGIVNDPILTPPAGEYEEPVQVTIICHTPNSTIHYTLNGNNPNTNSPVFTGEPINITSTTTVKALAVRQGWQNSQIVTGNYIMPLSADEESIPVLNTELLSAYPNPFNPSLTIPFSIKQEGLVTIEIFNIAGKKVKTIVNENLLEGKHQYIWQGKDDQGRQVSSGIYFYRMLSADYSSVKRVLYLK